MLKIDFMGPDYSHSKKEIQDFSGSGSFVAAVYDQACPKYDYQNAGDAGGTQVPVAVTNGDLVCLCVIPRLGQGGATAPQASVGAV